MRIIYYHNDDHRPFFVQNFFWHNIIKIFTKRTNNNINYICIVSITALGTDIVRRPTQTHSQQYINSEPLRAYIYVVYIHRYYYSAYYDLHTIPYHIPTRCCTIVRIYFTIVTLYYRRIHIIYNNNSIARLRFISLCRFCHSRRRRHPPTDRPVAIIGRRCKCRGSFTKIIKNIFPPLVACGGGEYDFVRTTPIA
jgi:hypothetical protein